MAAGAAGTRAVLALLVLCSMAAGAAGTSPEIVTNVTVGPDKVTLSCSISAPQLPITGHKWIHKEKTLQEDNNSGASTSYIIEGTMEEHSGIYECIFEANPQIRGQVNISVPPQVMAYKKSEHGNEGDTGVLTCKNPSFPAVTTWSWHKSGHGRLENASGRYIIKSSGNKTELRILKLDIEQDTGDYFCNATNSLGTGDATVNLRVRSRLAALWPFLGIVAEVLVLVTIIFIYEKRRKPDEVPDDDDGGSAPLKSNATNHKDKNVRQRNAN
ncbi:basigin isoform X1 [Molothrus ater]|uniref:basigin isoform X1 n=1 Tax=Molothrus ater TaxID=84834 RepID=UPI00174C2762|nr:basigin isoform X1 [Molothrus ater]